MDSVPWVEAAIAIGSICGVTLFTPPVLALSRLSSVLTVGIVTMLLCPSVSVAMARARLAVVRSYRVDSVSSQGSYCLSSAVELELPSSADSLRVLRVFLLSSEHFRACKSWIFFS